MLASVYGAALQAGREKAREMAAGQVGVMVEAFGEVGVSAAETALDYAIAHRAEAASRWLPIDKLAKTPTKDGRRRQVLLIAKYPHTPVQAWSDVYHSWWDEQFEAWARWPHKFPPTHYQDVVPPSGL